MKLMEHSSSPAVSGRKNGRHIAAAGLFPTGASWRTQAPPVNTEQQELARRHHASQEQHRFLSFLFFFGLFFFLSSLCPASRCRSLSDALMLGLLPEHNASNPLLIRLSSSRSPSPLPRSSFLISSLLPLNLLVFSRISPPFHTVTEGWKKNNTSIQKKNFACIFRTFQIHLLLIFFYMPFLNMLFLIIAKQMILQGFSYFPIFFCLE